MNTTAIETLNGSGDGSVAKSISDALGAYKTEVGQTYQLLGNIHSDASVTLTGEDLNTKYPSVGYVDTKVSGVSGDLRGLQEAVAQHTEDIGSNTDAIADEEARALAAEGAINTKIGTVAEGKDVVTMISEGDSATLAAAKEYAKEQADAASSSASGVASDLAAYKTTVADTYATQEALGVTNTNVTNLTSRVSTNETNIVGLQSAINDEETGLLKKVADNAAAAKGAADAAAANLETLTTQAGLISTNATNIQSNSDAIAAEVQRATAAEQANAKAASDAQATADAAIPAPKGECQNAANKCVLTYNNSAYAWEVIERATGEND